MTMENPKNLPRLEGSKADRPNTFEALIFRPRFEERKKET